MAERDEDRLLDHNYDGIQEYDNPMPRWWLYIFWATIIFSPFYYLYYHGMEGRSIHDRYNADMLALFEKQAAELLAMGPIKEATLADMQSDSAMMSAASQVFTSKCAQCHQNDGGGGIGPNLTDSYWIHGGRLTDIYDTVYNGVPEKGMLSWKNSLPLSDILAVSAYVGTLRGTSPSQPKGPQGDPFEYDRDAILAEEAAAAEGGAEAGADGGSSDSTVTPDTTTES